MRLILMIILTLIAFAANSVLNRMALASGDAGPAAFAALRMFSGAVFLALLVFVRGRLLRLRSPKRWIGTASLALYMLGFSFAYVALQAGVGALILFGGVQITMFAGAIAQGERPPLSRWIGSAVAFGGLVWLLWPGAAAAPNFAGAGLMAFAALGWGIYSLVGRGVADPLSETASNFICAAPIALIVWLIVPDGMNGRGALLAVTSGAITSGMGYALWYSVLPKLPSSVAALAQLTVPVIALAGGLVFLGEAPTLRFLIASAIVLGGVAFGVVVGRQRTSGSRAS